MEHYLAKRAVLGALKLQYSGKIQSSGIRLSRACSYNTTYERAEGLNNNNNKGIAEEAGKRVENIENMSGVTGFAAETVVGAAETVVAAADKNVVDTSEYRSIEDQINNKNNNNDNNISVDQPNSGNNVGGADYLQKT